jgi:hypothetical protein
MSNAQAIRGILYALIGAGLVVGCFRMILHLPIQIFLFVSVICIVLAGIVTLPERIRGDGTASKEDFGVLCLMLFLANGVTGLLF